jgi:hypothetical protein
MENDRTSHRHPSFPTRLKAVAAPALREASADLMWCKALAVGQISMERWAAAWPGDARLTGTLNPVRCEVVQSYSALTEEPLD